MPLYSVPILSSCHCWLCWTAFGSHLAYHTDTHLEGNHSEPEWHSDTRMSTRIKTQRSNSSIWSRRPARSRALFKPCILSDHDSALRNDDAIRKFWLGGSNRGEWILLKYSQRVLSLGFRTLFFRSTPPLYRRLFYCWCLNSQDRVPAPNCAKSVGANLDYGHLMYSSQSSTTTIHWNHSLVEWFKRNPWRVIYFEFKSLSKCVLRTSTNCKRTFCCFLSHYKSMPLCSPFALQGSAFIQSSLTTYCKNLVTMAATMVYNRNIYKDFINRPCQGLSNTSPSYLPIINNFLWINDVLVQTIVVDNLTSSRLLDETNTILCLGWMICHHWGQCITSQSQLIMFKPSRHYCRLAPSISGVRTICPTNYLICDYNIHYIHDQL